MTAARLEVLAALGGLPARLAVAARNAAARPTPVGEWTPREVVRHLIAVELDVWHPRLRQLVVEDHPTWPWLEPGPWAGEPDATLDRLLEIHAAARSHSVAMLGALDDAGWAKTGTHATFGELDAVGLMGRAIDHDEEHVGSFEQAQPQENSAE